MKTVINIILFIAGSTTIILFSRHYSEQSKEHHKLHHELIKENYRLNEWYQNHSNNTDCDTYSQPTSVSINCDKYEL